MGRLLIVLLQRWCWLRHGGAHPWGRTLDLHCHIGPWRNTIVRVCHDCGSARVFAA